MEKDILLPNSQYIDTNLGLKYLNANKKLYSKVLNSFFIRYKNFDINSIQNDEFQSEMHTLKGLCSTLGMERLSHLAKALHKEQTKELLVEFSEILSYVIHDLSSNKLKTLLIIDNNSDDINTLIEALGEQYDIMVMVEPNDDLTSSYIENVDIVFLSSLLDTPQIRHKLKQKNIVIINLCKPIELNTLLLAIKNI